MPGYVQLPAPEEYAAAKLAYRNSRRQGLKSAHIPVRVLLELPTRARCIIFFGPATPSPATAPVSKPRWWHREAYSPRGLAEMSR